MADNTLRPKDYKGEEIKAMANSVIALIKAMEKVDISGSRSTLNKDKFLDNNGRLIYY